MNEDRLGQSPRRVSVKIITPVVIVLILLVGSLFYFFAIRPSDSDYQIAIDQTSVFQKDVSLVSQSYGAINRPGYIKGAAQTFLETTSAEYKKAQDTLAKSSTVTKGIAGPAAYSQYKSVVDSYGLALDNLTKSVVTYLNVHNICTIFLANLDGIKTAAAYDSAASDCTKAIADTASVPYKKFNDQFYMQYLTNLKDLVANYRTSVEKPTDYPTLQKLYQAKLKIYNMGGLSLDLKIQPDPTADFQKLSESLSSQKNSFWR